MEQQCNFPLVIRINYPSQYSNTLFTCWLRAMRNPKTGQVTVLTSSSIESLLCLLVESFPPLVQRSLDQQSIRSWGQKGIVLLVNNQGTSPIFTHWFASPGYGISMSPGDERNTTICWFRIHKTFWRNFPQPWKVSSASWCCNYLQKVIHYSTNPDASFDHLCFISTYSD